MFWFFIRSHRHSPIAQMFNDCIIMQTMSFPITRLLFESFLQWLMLRILFFKFQFLLLFIICFVQFSSF